MLVEGVQRMRVSATVGIPAVHVDISGAWRSVTRVDKSNVTRRGLVVTAWIWSGARSEPQGLQCVLPKSFLFVQLITHVLVIRCVGILNGE